MESSPSSLLKLSATATPIGVKLDEPNIGSSALPRDSANFSIPDHELLRRIGKGSYGEVWLARNIMGTYRAIKIIRRDGFDSDSPFRRELGGIKKFEPISRTHEGFVDVLQIGLNEPEGYFYYVMEIADDLQRGQEIDPATYVPNTLGKALARLGRFPVDQCVQTGMALCQALHHLHSHGLIHRDIKPSNIVFVNGVPKLADIGLVTDSEHAQTFVGTEGFIPPEGPGTISADIYSLGKALYEIASGRDRLDFPALPSDLQLFPDREPFLELNEALIRACRQKPEDRYGSARDMYEDFALLASSKSLRKLRILERRWASLKRSSGIGAAALLFVGLIGFPIVREKQHAEETRERAIGVHSANGIHKLDQGDFLGGLSDFAEIFQLEAKRPSRFKANQSRIAAILSSSPRLTQMLFLNDRIGSVAFTRDGRSLLAAEKTKLARQFDIESGREISVPLVTGRLFSADYSPQDKYIVTGSESGGASLWDPKTGKELKLKDQNMVFCAKFSHDGRLLATGGRDGFVRIWNPETAEKLFELPGHKGSLRAIAFSSDDHLLAVGSTDYLARVWDLSKAVPDFFVLPHSDWVTDLAFSPDSRRLLTASHDGWARLWDLDTAQEIQTVMHHDGQIAQAGYSPDGSLIYTASMDTTVRFWEAATTRPVTRNHVLRHSSSVFSAAFSADGRRFATGCADGTVRVWELGWQNYPPTIFTGVVNETASMAALVENGKIVIRNLLSNTNLRTIPFNGELRRLALSSNAKLLAAHLISSQDQRSIIALWNTNSTEPVRSIPISTTNHLSHFALSPDGSILVFQVTNELHVIDASSGQTWPIPKELLIKAHFAFDPSSSRFAVSGTNRVGIFNLRDRSPACPTFTFEGDIHHLSFSAAGDSLLVSQGDDYVTPKPAILISFTGASPKLTRLWHKDGLSQGVFRPDGLRVATAGENRQALVWDIASAREVFSPLVHPQQVVAIAYSQDGQWLASASGDRKIQVWDADTGSPITPPLVDDRISSRILFTPDRNRFVTVNEPLQFSVWQLPHADISPQDAIAISHLLNSDLRVSGEQGTKPLAEAWRQLRNRMPAQFPAPGSNETAAVSTHVNHPISALK